MDTNEDSLARLVNRQIVKLRELRAELKAVLVASKTMVELVDENLPNDYLDAEECEHFRFLSEKIKEERL